MANSIIIPRRKRWKYYGVTLICIVCVLTYVIFSVNSCRQISFRFFEYPIDANISAIVEKYKTDGHASMLPINVYKYKFITDLHQKCNTNGKPIVILFLIKSAVNNFKRRQAIRDTWGNESLLQNFHIRRVFLMGLPYKSNKTVEASIKAETLHNKDIVQINFLDSYYNNTLKTVGGINWAAKYCNNAKFVMEVDDDFYVATENLVAHLLKKQPKELRHLFMGNVFVDVPQRGLTQKWYMPFHEYPFDSYPPFVSAGAMIWSMEFLLDLFIAIPFVKHFKYDDIFLAIVAYKLNVKPQHNDGVKIDKVKHDDRIFPDILASHGYSSENTDDLYSAWAIHRTILAADNR